MIDVYRKLMVLFDARERKRFYILMLLLVLVAIAEVIGISIFLILLRILSDPSKIYENEYLSWLYENLGFSSNFGFQIFLASVVLIIVLASMIIKAGGHYAIVRFSMMRGFTLSSRLLSSYLHQPYAWFLDRNTADIQKSVLSEVAEVVHKVIVPGSRLLANVALSVLIIGFLLVVDPLIAISSALLLGGAYAGIYFLLRGLLLRLGQRLLDAQTSRFRLTQEATGGIKEVKLMSLEDSYIARFQGPSISLARSGAMSQVINLLPRFVLEALTYGVLLGIVLVMILRNNGDITSAIPVLGIFAISVMRLLPALQQIYASVASIKNTEPVFNNVYNDYCAAIAHRTEKVEGQDDTEALPLEHEISLRNISFTYNKAEKQAVRDLNLTIPARSTIGFVGGTGAGKTSVIDMILGLLIPDKGEILVDGVALDRDNIRAWRRTLGYVPQSIFLSDTSIARNIAFSARNDSEVDMAAVERASRTAMLHDFITRDLPDGYQTQVGERGVRLSGGQRQRIGIARALYHNPSLLILDEATAALDNLTESAVMEAVQNLRDDKTIIMIAHRLSTVRNCDRIFLLERGQVVGAGTFDELVQQNDSFRRMAANE